MSEPVDKSPESTTSSTSTIITIIIVSVLLISCIVAIIFILRSNDLPFYPLSTFKYGDTIVIRPAILTDNGNVNQYLCQDSRYQYSNGSTIGYAYGDNAYPATFTGDRTNKGSQWTLSRYSTTIPGSKQNDAENSIVAGFGNRFYLHNNNYPFANDQKGRLRYQLLNEQGFGMGYNTSTAVVGGDPNKGTTSYFESEILMYFMPTNYPDIYYLLFPACADIVVQSTNTTIQPNNAIVNIRPWAQNNATNRKATVECIQPTDLGVYNPYFPNGTLNQDVMIMSMDASGRNPPPVQPPFLQANARLFHVTLA